MLDILGITRYREGHVVIQEIKKGNPLERRSGGDQ